MDTASLHLLCEYYGCDRQLLDDQERVAEILRRAVSAAGATVVAAAFHQLEPQGVSGVVLLEESHFAIHTWPEHGYASADLFTCGCCEPELGHRLLLSQLGAERSEVMVVERGASCAGGRGMQLVRHYTEPAADPAAVAHAGPGSGVRSG